MSIKIHITSDTHIERYLPYVPDPKTIIPTECDILVLAGDVGHCQYWTQYSSFVSKACQQFKQVILIPGNHEYYIKGNPKLTIAEINNKLNKLADSIINLSLLNDQYMIFEDYGIILFGTVLWSYLPDNDMYKQVRIYSGKKYVTGKEWNTMHLKCLNNLIQIIKLAEEKDMKLIVISHYAPSFKNTIPPEFETKNNSLYATNLDYLLKSDKINVWYYGHTGHNCQYQTDGNTCLYGNQHYEPDYNARQSITIKKFN